MIDRTFVESVIFVEFRPLPCVRRICSVTNVTISSPRTVRSTSVTITTRPVDARSTYDMVRGDPGYIPLSFCQLGRIQDESFIRPQNFSWMEEEMDVDVGGT